MITIGSNQSSLAAERRLQNNADHLSRVYEKLSTGQRINRASDDAAGLAIADSLRVEARTYSTALRNISDGVSVSNIMSGALESQLNILTRMKELAEQSANGIYSDDQRVALNNEYRELLKECNRIARTASFNGIDPLLGSRGNAAAGIQIQSGITSGNDSLLTLDSVDSAAFSGIVGANDDLTGDNRMNATDVNWFKIHVRPGTSIDTISEYFGGALLQTEITDSNGENRQVYIGLCEYRNFLDRTLIGLIAFEENLRGNPPGYAYSELPGSVISLNLNFWDGATGSLSLDLRSLKVERNSQGAVRNSAVDFTGVEGPKRARQALETITNRMEDLNQFRGRIGAMQSRFDTAAQVIATQRENSWAAESRIRDADIGAEAAQQIRLSLLQNMGASILAQAGSGASIALQLIRGGL